MLRAVKAEIIAIGTEILLGEIIDTNSAHIAQQLPELGIDLYYKSVVGDNRGRVMETFQRAWDRSDLVITTGGLGPTEDDMTREGIAELLGEEPFVDPDLEQHLRGFFASRGYPDARIQHQAGMAAPQRSRHRQPSRHRARVVGRTRWQDHRFHARRARRDGTACG